MTEKNVLAFDLGASSGRGMLASFDGKKINLKEIHRFPHNFSVLNGHAYWNILSLMDEMKKGLSLCKSEISGVGFDTWGVTLTLPSYSDHPEHCHDNCREFQVTLPLWKGNHSLLPMYQSRRQEDHCRRN